MSTLKFHDLHMRDTSHSHWRVGALAIRATFGIVVCLLIYSVLCSRVYARDANELQPLASIRAAAEAFVRENIVAPPDTAPVATANELDTRLRLPLCDQALTAFSPHGAALDARNTIGVRCTHGEEWTVYIPVSVETEIKVWILRHSLPRDAHVAASDLDAQPRRVSGVGTNYLADLSLLQRQHLKRAIDAGTPLTADLLTRDMLIRRGQQVMLIASVQGIDVRANGMALAEGGTADRIRVQNLSSLKIVEGVIESGNLVRVGL